MKTINELEQEAKQAREVAIATTDNPFELMSTKVDSIITASVAMMTYQLALSHEAIDCVPGDSESCDGWIDWNGGDIPVDVNALVDIKKRDGLYLIGFQAGILNWSHDGNPMDIIAYRIVK